MRKLAFCLAAAATLAVSSPALAQSRAPSGPMPNTAGNVPAQPPMNDEVFAKTVAISDMFEVQSSKLAADKAQNRELKEFADHMIQAHTKTSKELASLVKGTTGSRSGDIMLPKELDQKHASKLKQLQSISGASFDKAYRDAQVQAHEEAVQLFSSYVQDGRDQDLKNWAAKTLPELREHLKMIQNIKL
jgi:putative membrane protein